MKCQKFSSPSKPVTFVGYFLCLKPIFSHNKQREARHLYQLSLLFYDSLLKKTVTKTQIHVAKQFYLDTNLDLIFPCGKAGFDDVSFTSVPLFGGFESQQKAASWRLFRGTVNYISELRLSSDQPVGERHWEQHRVWREGLIGVYKYLRCASSGLPSAEVWLETRVKQSLAPVLALMLRLEPHCSLIFIPKNLNGYVFLHVHPQTICQHLMKRREICLQEQFKLLEVLLNG